MVQAPNIQTILCGTDLSDNTRQVFRLAVSQARRYEARLLMLNVVEPLGSTGTAIIASYLSGEEATKINQESAQGILAVMREKLDAYCKEELSSFGLDWVPPINILVATGNPCEQILEVAKKYEADMIIMGTSTRSFLASAIMGTTARRVARHSEIPILLVPQASK